MRSTRWTLSSSEDSRLNVRSPFTVSRSPVIDKDTSFSETPGSSKFSTRSSLVSCTSRTGAQVRTADPVVEAVGLPRKLSNRRLTSPCMLVMLRNGSHLSTDTNGRQRSIAIPKPSLFAGLLGPRLYLSTYVIYHLSTRLSSWWNALGWEI